MSSIKLTYFNAKAVGEGIRMILVYSGKGFKDIRVDYNDWVNHLKNQTPFGKLPVLEIDNEILHQSVAICRYLGKQTNLGGINSWEDLHIDIVAETFCDLKGHISNFFFEMNDEQKKKKLHLLLNETIPHYFDRFEKSIKVNRGYLALDRLSWVDFYFVGYSETMEAIVRTNVFEKYPNISQLRKTLYEIPSIQEWISKRPVSQY